MKNRIKINALAIIAALLLCIWFPSLLIRSSSGLLDDCLEYFGIALVALGLLLRISARGYKAEHSANGNALVTGGPYSLVRNPMYLGIIICGSGIVLVIGQPWALLFFLAGFFLTYSRLFKKEEKILEEAFGQTYREYKKSVPRIFPSFRGILKGRLAQQLPLKTQWFKREMLSVAPVLIGVMFFEIGEEWNRNGWLGVWHILLLVVICAGVFVSLTAFAANKNEKISKHSPDSR